MSILTSASKSLFLSKTFWGAAVAFLAAVFPMLGIGVTSEDVANVSTHGVGLIDRGLELAGILFAIYGRVVATTMVHVTK